MILFTGGFPYAGKSEFVRLLLKELGGDNNIIIEPKSFYPQGFDKLPPEKQTAIGIAAWDVCMEEVEKAIVSTSPDKLIIFDTTAKRLLMMRPLFLTSKIRHHKVFYVFVGASIDKCKERSKDKWKDTFENDYATSFEETVPRLKRLADTFKLVINNEPDKKKLIQAAKEMADGIREARR